MYQGVTLRNNSVFPGKYLDHQENSYLFYTSEWQKSNNFNLILENSEKISPQEKQFFIFLLPWNTIYPLPMYCLQKDSEVYRLPDETAEVVEELKKSVFQ